MGPIGICRYQTANFMGHFENNLRCVFVYTKSMKEMNWQLPKWNFLRTCDFEFRNSIAFVFGQSTPGINPRDPLLIPNKERNAISFFGFFLTPHDFILLH